MIKQEFIDYDLEAHPLQIKTDSKTGSGDHLTLMLFKKETGDISRYNDLGYLGIRFRDPPGYWIKHCYKYRNLPPVSSEEKKIWTFTKTSTNLIIDCNGQRVMDIEFGSVSQFCATRWSQDVAKIAFYKGGDADDDTASDEYRIAPQTCTALPDTANLEIDSGTLPVEQGAKVTVKCSDGYRLEGNTIITCHQGKVFVGTSSCLKG